jgi:hypothetical protein
MKEDDEKARGRVRQVSQKGQAGHWQHRSGGVLLSASSASEPASSLSDAAAPTAEEEQEA